MTSLSIRTLIERLSRRRAFWKSLPTPNGPAPLKVTPDAALKHLLPGKKGWDPMLYRFCAEHVRAGDAVWDIGANVGEFSLLAAKRGAKVLAIEPDPWLATLILETSRHPANLQLSLDPLCAALAEEPGVARLSVASRGRASNFLEAFGGRSMAGGARYGVAAPVLAMDLLMRALGPPHVIKLDVEGAEFAVLSGGAAVLREARPIMMVEVDNATREDVFKLLARQRYTMAGLDPAPPTASGAPGGMNWLALPQ